MASSIRRTLSALILASVAVCATLLPVHAAIGQADLMSQHHDAMRKAGDDPKGRVEAHLAYLAAATRMATAEKDAQFLKGLVNAWEEAADDMRAYIKAAGEADPEVIRLRADVNTIRVTMVDAYKSLKQADLQAPMPADVYKGADKSALLALVKQAWTQNYPNEKILTVRFDHATWVRHASRDWIANGGYYRNNDNSVLEVQVIVKADAETATIFPVYLQKDNANPKAGAKAGRKLNDTGNRTMLLTNVK